MRLIIKKYSYNTKAVNEIFKKTYLCPLNRTQRLIYSIACAWKARALSVQLQIILKNFDKNTGTVTSLGMKKIRIHVSNSTASASKIFSFCKIVKWLQKKNISMKTQRLINDRFKSHLQIFKGTFLYLTFYINPRVGESLLSHLGTSKYMYNKRHSYKRNNYVLTEKNTGITFIIYSSFPAKECLETIHIQMIWVSWAIHGYFSNHWYGTRGKSAAFI